MKHRPILFAAMLMFPMIAFAQKETPMLRDEVAGIKKKLVASLDALGQPPQGYSKEREDFNLPTDVSKREGSGLFNTFYASAERVFGSKKTTEKSAKEMGKEYQKKMAEAQAKGDMQTVVKLTQEMQQMVGQMQLKAVEGDKEPIRADIQFNVGRTDAIDPDAVVFEKTGVIALKQKDDGTDEKGSVTILFDPIALKDTKQLSKAELRLPEKGTSSKTAVYNIVVQLHGPMDLIETWSKSIETGKILAQIEGKP